MIKKLSSTDRQRVSTALSDCARKTKDITDSAELANEVYSILSDKLGDNPGLFKAACQVYNSCKSIHKLSEATDDNRGDSFSILDVQEMSDRLSKDKANKIRKAASAPASFYKIAKPEDLKGSIQKTASASRDSEPELQKVPAPRIGKSEFRSFLREELADIEDLLRKHAGSVKTAKMLAEDALDMFVSAFATESRHVRKEAAARLYANYGSVAENLISEFGSRRPLSKIASADYVDSFAGTPSIPDTVIYRLAKKAMDSMSSLSQIEEDDKTITELMARSVIDYTKAYTELHKEAAAEATIPLAGGALASLGRMLGLEEIDDKKIRDEVFSTEMTNNIVSHSYQRAFIRAATNNAIRKYALHKIVAAFNRAVAKLPPNTRMVPATANQQLIEGMMIDELAKGAVPSKADTEIISSLANTIGKLKTDKGIYEGNAANA